MNSQNNWSLKGVFYECCRTEGHCPLWFGRDLWDKPCTNFVTWQVIEGQINNLDMSGINIITQQDNIGPKFNDQDKPKREGAIYISDTATKEQRIILEPFTKIHMRTDKWKKCLGVKFVKINIQQREHTYHITMPFGEQKITLTTGGDGINPVRIENAAFTFVTNVKVGNGALWTYHDYGRNLNFYNTSSVIADFNFHED